MALEPVRDGGPIDDLALGVAWAQQTLRALTSLAREERIVLQLTYFHAMTEHEIAHQLGVPVSVVQINAARGLASLNRAIDIMAGPVL